MSKYKINFLRGGRLGLLPMIALAATLFVGGNLRAASGDSQASQLLAASLPSGVTLKSASDTQMEEAVKAAVSSNPTMAEGIVRVAIITKVPASERNAPVRRTRRAPRGDGKSTSQNSTYNPWATAGLSNGQSFVFIAATTSDPAGFIAAVVAAAVAAAPDQAAAIAAAAAQAAPAYAVTIVQAAQQAAPGQASAIASAVTAVVPALGGEIAAAAGGASTTSEGGGAVGDSAVGAPSFPSGGGGGGGSGVTDLTPATTPNTNT